MYFLYKEFQEQKLTIQKIEKKKEEKDQAKANTNKKKDKEVGEDK